MAKDVKGREPGKAELDNRKLVDFWDKAFAMSDEDRAEVSKAGPEGWKELAPSAKLFDAACSLGRKKKVLDYGCGSAWASIIAAKSGCPDVTAVDAAPGALKAAAFYAKLYGVQAQLHTACGGLSWFNSVKTGTFDGIICSNVLDVVPPETSQAIIAEIARAAAPGATVIIGLNFHLSQKTAEERGMKLADGTSLYVDGVLRLVSRSDDEWTRLFEPHLTVENLDHFAWPGEASETRRLFICRAHGN